jgi:hypothetical protein
MKRLKVGIGRLRRLTLAVWVDMSICYAVKWKNNYDKTPSNALDDETIERIRIFVLSLPLEPWPCERCSGKRYLLSIPISRHKMWISFCGIEKLSGNLPISFPTFLQYFEISCPDVQV